MGEKIKKKRAPGIGVEREGVAGLTGGGGG